MNKIKAPKLTIVIPALNEEQSIASIIERCLAARERIEREGGIREVEVIVVSDGSTDATARIASSYSAVKTIVFERNRGYGAAIQEGFNSGEGDYLAFIDADGTCDPEFFAELCRELTAQNAEISLGSRMGPESKMPWIRRVGNVGYALLLGWLCGRSIRDTASGMRVIRRTAFDSLSPLPNGLNFTPAMSAKALFHGHKVVEIPMSYSERVGRSKLNVLKDGVRFLKVILAAALLYQPEKILVPIIGGLTLVSVIIMVHPIEMYFSSGRVEEWMIYRFLACLIASVVVSGLIGLLVALEKLGQLTRNAGRAGFWAGFALRAFEQRYFPAFVSTLVLFGIGVAWPGIREYVVERTISLHWSRSIIGGTALMIAFQFGLSRFLLAYLSLTVRHQKKPELRAVRGQSSAAPRTVRLKSGKTAKRRA